MDELNLWVDLADYAREDAYWGLLKEARKARSEQTNGLLSRVWRSFHDTLAAQQHLEPPGYRDAWGLTPLN